MNAHSVGGTELSTSCSVLLWLVNGTWYPLQATVKRKHVCTYVFTVVLVPGVDQTGET